MGRECLGIFLAGFWLLLANGAEGKLMTKGTWGNAVHWQGNHIGCKCEDGLNLDWFIAYKLAKVRKSANAFVREGYGHAWIHPGQAEWTLSGKSINDSASAVAVTLQPIFQNQGDDFLFLTYNDQPPDGSVLDSGGHTKGVVLANDEGGLWLQHSVPHFLKTSSGHYSYPTTGAHNGQTFFCMSLSRDQINGIVGSILQITKPHVNDHHFPPKFDSLYPNIKSLLDVDGEGLSRDFPPSNSFDLTTKDLRLKVFAKSPRDKKEIYSDWLAKALTTNLKVQSWLNGPHPLNCTLDPFRVENIEEKAVTGNEFSTHNDHSKWAVSGEDKHWICVADLNRMEHQLVRGGAAVCSQDPKIWQSFLGLIRSLQPCSQ